MMARALIPLLLLLTLCIAACNGGNKTTNSASPTPDKKSTPDPMAATRGLYAKNCQECHGAKGDGGPVKLQDGTKLKVPSLREGHALRHPDSDFVKQITKGGDGMPAFKDKLTQQQIDDMVRFVRQEFQGGQTPPAESSKPAK
jgi:mono/diheme cytochrome c family protein